VIADYADLIADYADLIADYTDLIADYTDLIADYTDLIADYTDLIADYTYLITDDADFRIRFCGKDDDGPLIKNEYSRSQMELQEIRILVWP
jgi:hypothetical protein